MKKSIAAMAATGLIALCLGCQQTTPPAEPSAQQSAPEASQEVTQAPVEDAVEPATEESAESSAPAVTFVTLSVPNMV